MGPLSDLLLPFGNNGRGRVGRRAARGYLCWCPERRSWLAALRPCRGLQLDIEGAGQNGPVGIPQSPIVHTATCSVS